MTPTVHLDFGSGDSMLTRELCEDLVGQIFADQPTIKSVRLEALPDGHSGYSALRLLILRPTRADGINQNPLLVRIGPRAAIETERRRYEAYVRSLVGPGKVPQQPAAMDGPLAAVTYDYVQGSQKQPPQSLRDFLADDDSPTAHIDQACKAVRTLFRDTLAQAPEANGWYADGRTGDEQRALWFYNTVLPPTLTLRDARPVATPQSDLALTDCLAAADSPAGRELHNQTAFLAASAGYPQLRIVERSEQGDQCTLRLYLYEYKPMPGEQYPIDDLPWGEQKGGYRRMRPLAARIDVTGPAELLFNLPDNLDCDDQGWPAIVLEGQIEQTRYATLDDTRRQHFGQLYARSGQSTIISGGNNYDNPLRRYHSLLWQPRRLTTSIVHGDLNMNNILLSRTAGGETIAWLIDFDKTTNGAHAVFDAVKLETEFKLHVLPHWLENLEELLRLEQLLHQGLIDPDAPLDFGQNEYLRQAYQFIATIRRAALHDLTNPIAPQEYYLGLVAYGLAALKYPNLYEQKSARWLPMPAKIKPLAVTAFVSATFAAWALPQLDEVEVTARSWPEPPPSAVRLLARPQVIGRDDMLAAALHQLQTEERVVLLHGPVGSGRGTIARYIGADLQRRGFTLWHDQRSHARTLEELLSLVAYRRMEVLAEQPGDAALPHPTTHNEDILHKLHRLHDQLERSARPVVLLFNLAVADADLRDCIIRLANMVSRTAIVLIADAPVGELRSGVSLAVLPFDQAGVAEYVRRRHLSLAPSAVTALATASQGLPWLIELLIKEARKHTGQDTTLGQAIEQTAPQFDIERHLSQRLRDLSEPIRCLLALDGVLQEHAPELLDEGASIEYEQLQGVVLRAIGDKAAAVGAPGWNAYPPDDAPLKEYHQYIVHEYTHLRQKMAARAHYHLAPAMRLRLYTAVAGCYAGADAGTAIFGDAERYGKAIFRAATFQALAARWDELVGSLGQLAALPDQLYSGRCRTIYSWAGLALKHTRPSEGGQLRQLAGDCAAYLGDFGAAVEHYSYAIALPSKDSQAHPRLLARLLSAYDALGDKERVAATCGDLIGRTQPGNPLYALALAYKGALNLFADPDQAAAELAQAIERAGEPRDSMASEECALWVRLHDALALAETYRGRSHEAIRLLELALPYTEGMLALKARIISNLAIIHYYLGNGPQDMWLARQRFADALAIREDLQDQVGILRTAQNLANLCADLGASTSDWDEAITYFGKADQAASHVQAIDRYRNSANLMDLLIHRGDFRQAEAVFARAWAAFEQADGNAQQSRDQATHILLLLNRAKLALWTDNSAECERYLNAVLTLIADVDQPIDKIEWAQIALENHLRLDAPFQFVVTDWLSADYDLDEGGREAAELAFAQGLLALARTDYPVARARLEESHQIWHALTYHFRAALVLYWLAECAERAGDRLRMDEIKTHAAQALKPFGDIPVVQRLGDVGGQFT